ncbi:LolA family protein [Salipaludibacillus sp. HK11]|uniref:LolA family protein n=1 Tax=Salipaludibacillus sp. HK11 TaxID=3394320 RepID=UPI0039FBDA09
MKKIMSLLILVVAFTAILTACGEKSQEDVINDLEERSNELTGYKANATMTLQTGEEPQVYEVEVWHQSPMAYRVVLSHVEKDQSQIILRNEEGVFVLTPALNKSFRFQSDWPENNSQVYLYESLINDILTDPERVFTASEDHYRFQTNTNYTNKNLNQQEVMLHKKDLTPASVQVMDAELSVLVEVTFENFELNASFVEDDFDMDRNMEGAQLQMDVPTMTGENEVENNDENNDENNVENNEEVDEGDAIDENTTDEDNNFSVLYPMYEPQGTTFSHSEDVVTDSGIKVILSYEGDQPFTLIQQQSRVIEASTPIELTTGEPIDLGFTFGVLSKEGDHQSVSWSYEGTDFFLVSDTMDTENLAAVARSVYGTQEK